MPVGESVKRVEKRVQKKIARKSASDRAFAKFNIKKESDHLAKLLQELRVDYEQFFLGLIPFQPEKLHREVVQLIRLIRKAPFKKQVDRFRQLALEYRYQTYNDYWQRVLRQREAGTYSRDVFKAELRERLAQEEAERGTAKGEAAAGMRNLFQAYKQALEQHSGQKQKVDFELFQKALVERARAHRERYGDQKLTFKVVVKGGKVSLKAKVKGGVENAGA